MGQRYTDSIYPIAGAFADWLGNYRAGFTLIGAEGKYTGALPGKVLRNSHYEQNRRRNA